MPQRSLPLGPSFLPVTSALVTFRSTGAEPQVHSVGWFGVVCTSPPLLSVCIREVAGKLLLRAGDPFAVNLPGEELLQALAGWSWPGWAAELAASAPPPLSFLAGEGVGVPLVSGCPVRIECRCRSLSVRFGQHHLCGEILAVHLDGCRHELTAPVDLCRLAPFQRRRFQGRGSGLEQRGAS